MYRDAPNNFNIEQKDLCFEVLEVLESQDINLEFVRNPEHNYLLWPYLSFSAPVCSPQTATFQSVACGAFGC